MLFWQKILPRRLKQPRLTTASFSIKELLIVFRQHLEHKKAKPVTVKNYLSDLRHFLGWTELELAAQSHNPLSLRSKNTIPISKISPALLQRYKTYLLANKIAKSTVNRRLATVRQFCQFCYDNGLSRQNPAQNLTNFAPRNSRDKEIHDLASQFGAWLKNQGASRNTIKNYTADVRQYLLKTMI